MFDNSADSYLQAQSSHSVAKQTARIQELMKAGKRGDSDFLLAFHDVYDAVSFALTFQNELMDVNWPEELLTSSTGYSAAEVIKVSPEEKDTRARMKTIATALSTEETERGSGQRMLQRSSTKILEEYADKDLLITAFKGLRVKMGVHMGSDESGECF